MQKIHALPTAFLLVFLALGSLVLSGCAAALIAGGAVGGYAIAKNMDSNNPPPAQTGNKGFFGGK